MEIFLISLKRMFFELFSCYVNVADVINGRRLNPSYQCCIDGWAFCQWMNSNPKVYENVATSQTPSPMGRECGSMPCSVAYNLVVSPPILFYIPCHTMASNIAGIHIYMGAAGRTGAYKMQNHYYYKAHKSDFSLSERSERFSPLQKQLLKWWTNRRRSNLHEIAFLPNLFCICTENMQASASKSSFGTGYEPYSRCNCYGLS